MGARLLVTPPSLLTNIESWVYIDVRIGNRVKVAVHT